MNNLAEQLVRELQRKMTGGNEGENPLVTIGLAPGVVDLGLGDEDLWRYCRTASRFLVAQFHPRLQNDEVTEYQHRYSKAFEDIKDRGIFQRALDDFKSQTRDERSELASLRRTVQYLRQSFNQSRTESDREFLGEKFKMREIQKTLQLVTSRFLERLYYAGQSFKREEGRQVERCTIEKCRNILALRVVYSYKDGDELPKEGGIQELRNEYQQWLDRCQHECFSRPLDRADLCSKTRLAGISIQSVQKIFDEALKEFGALPVICWGEEEALIARGFDKLVVRRANRAGSIHQEVMDSVQSFIQTTGVSLNELDLGYRRALMAIRDSMTKAGLRVVRSLQIEVKWLEVDDNKIRIESGRRAKDQHVFAGSLGIEDVVWQRVSDAKINHEKYGQAYDLPQLAVILPRLNPLLCRHSFMVFSSILPTVLPYEHLPRRGGKQNRRSIPQFQTDHYVLGIVERS